MIFFVMEVWGGRPDVDSAREVFVDNPIWLDDAEAAVDEYLSDVDEVDWGAIESGAEFHLEVRRSIDRPGRRFAVAGEEVDE